MGGSSTTFWEVVRMNLLALSVSNETLIGIACVVVIIAALFWIFGRR
jgi:uncharacterized membrane protein